MIPTRRRTIVRAASKAAARRGRASGWLLVASFVLVAGVACAGQGVSGMDAQRAFPDPRVAELANAAVAGDVGRVHALTQAGVDVDAHGDKQATPLQWALLSRSTRGMETLLDAGADPAEPGIDGDTVIHLAAMADDPRYLALLLARGADPNARNGITGAPPLFSALRGGRDTQFDALLAAGADPDATDRVGNTALHQAAKYNDAPHALALLQAGTDPDARNTQGVTFQRYLFKTQERVLSSEAKRGREAIRGWLRAHDVAIEDPGAR
jgi:ankyrin repeat protein